MITGFIIGVLFIYSLFLTAACSNLMKEKKELQEELKNKS